MLSRPRSTIARIARVFTTFSLGLAVAVANSVTAFAQGVPVVRDAEIEALVRDYARPIFRAAGLAKSARRSREARRGNVIMGKVVAPPEMMNSAITDT